MKGILSIDNERYIINKEKGVVTYFIEYGIRDFNKGNFFDILNYKVFRYMDKISNRLNHSSWLVVGVSKCSPDDTFDEKKGIQIARNRAEIKLSQIEQMFIIKLFKEIDIIGEYLSDLYKKRENMIEEKRNFIRHI